MIEDPSRRTVGRTGRPELRPYVRAPARRDHRERSSRALHRPDPVAEGEQPDGSSETAGADLFKRWIWLPAPLAVGYIATVLATDGLDAPWKALVALSAALCLPAQAAAWLWASNAWKRYGDWRLVISVLLFAGSLAAGVAGAAGRPASAAVRSYRLGIAPHDAVAAGGSEWVSDPHAGVVYRLDRQSKVVDTIPLSGAFEFATGETSLWVSRLAGEETGSALTELGHDGEPLRTLALPSRPADIAAGGGSVWIAFPESGDLGRIDATTGSLDTWHVGSAPSSLALVANWVWVTDMGSSSLYQIDASTGEIVRTIDTGHKPVSIAADAHGIFVANEDENTVTHYAYGSRAAREFRVRTEPTDLAIDGDLLWIVSQTDQHLSALDVATGEIEYGVALGGRPIKLEVVDSDVVVTNPGSGTVHRVPVRLAEEDGSDAA